VAGSKNWYLRRGKTVRGPFPEGLISRHILLGRIRESDEVSRDRAEWQPVADHPELIPEVLRAARAHPDDEEAQQHLEAARRWADERGPVHEPPGSQERRSTPADTARSGGPRGPGVPVNRVKRYDYMVIALLVGALVLLPFLLPSQGPGGEPDCTAPPAPGIDWSNCRLPGEEWPNSDLRGATLRNADLSGAVLRASNLAGADLAYANLSLANLRGTNLREATLVGASLRRADLRHADLSDADLSYADLEGAQLEGAVLEGARLDNALLEGGILCLPGSVGECIPARP